MRRWYQPQAPWITTDIPFSSAPPTPFQFWWASADSMNTWEIRIFYESDYGSVSLGDPAPVPAECGGWAGKEERQLACSLWLCNRHWVHDARGNTGICLLPIPQSPGTPFLVWEAYPDLSLYTNEGIQSRPPQDVPLWRNSYFELKAITTLWAEEKHLSLS